MFLAPGVGQETTADDQRASVEEAHNVQIEQLGSAEDRTAAGDSDFERLVFLFEGYE